MYIHVALIIEYYKDDFNWWTRQSKYIKYTRATLDNNKFNKSK